MSKFLGRGDDDSGQKEQNPEIPSDPGGDGTNLIIGRRLTNPLGDLTSCTYQISLYMITPDAYDAFVASGRRRINALTESAEVNTAGGAFLVAQGGGINNSTQLRAPGFELDYMIDNLTFKTLSSGKATLTASNNTTFKFDVIEPYGFSFITKLKLAADTLGEYAKQGGWPTNPIRQFFILGIRFFGYDEQGKVADIEDVYEQFYDVNIKSMKFKLDGKATVYNIEAASVAPSEGFGLKRGRINNSKLVEANDVRTAIQELFNKINVEEKELLDKGSIQHKNEYAIEYIGDAREIAEASLLAPEDIDKFRWPGSGTRTTDQSNAAVEVRANADNTKRALTFNQDTPIQEAISAVIKQSSYLRDALKIVYTTALEPDPQTGETPEQKPNTKKKAKWYNLSVELSKAKWDELRSDWAYRITYVIQTYETPIFSSPYVNPGANYYGPHKRYEYYFTGQNREVLGYEQKLDNTYFNVALDPSARPLTDRGGAGNGSDSDVNVPQVTGKQTSQSRLGRLGQGLEAQNTYVTSLYDPGAYAQAKLSILGDPDFLMRESPDSIGQVYDRFYGSNGFTVNPNGGQVFIEVDFKEAVDYNSSKTAETAAGTLNINDSILFFPYPPEIADIVKGVSYQVQDVTSKFSGGKFTQELKLLMNDFGKSEAESDEARDPPADDSTSEKSRSGLTKDSKSRNSAVVDPEVPVPNATNSADDDSGG